MVLTDSATEATQAATDNRSTRIADAHHIDDRPNSDLLNVSSKYRFEFYCCTHNCLCNVGQMALSQKSCSDSTFQLCDTICSLTSDNITKSVALYCYMHTSLTLDPTQPDPTRGLTRTTSMSGKMQWSHNL